MNCYKKLLYVFLGCSISTAFIFFMTLFVYDPLKLYHKPWKYKTYLQENMREQAAGIINNWDFDSVILGTSMTENTSAREASEKLGGSFVNISLAGSDYFERSIILHYLLRKKKIKKVLYSLDSGDWVDLRKGDPTYQLKNWIYLYDDNPVNDIYAYINNKYIKCLFSFKSKRVCMGKELDFDRPNAWYRKEEESKRFGGIDNWFKAQNSLLIRASFRMILESIQNIKKGQYKTDPELGNKIIQSREYLDEYVLHFVREYPKTEFIFISPPLSRINYAINAQYNKPAFERYKASLRYMTKVSDTYVNMKLFGWGNEAFLDDIANYKDLGHYEYKINSWMLQRIKKNEGLLTAENIDKYLSVFEKKASDYNLFILGEKIVNYLYPKAKLPKEKK